VDIYEFPMSDTVSSDASVVLHVYDIDGYTARVNNVVKTLFGTGIYHVGVEVYGLEWFFGQSFDDMTGVSCHEPKMHRAHHYRESVLMGTTPLSEEQVFDLLDRLKEEWPGYSYHLYKRNCISFADALLKSLEVKGPPSWLFSAMGAASAVGGVLEGTVSTMREVNRWTGLSGAVGNLGWRRSSTGSYFSSQLSSISSAPSISRSERSQTFQWLESRSSRSLSPLQRESDEPQHSS